MREDVNHDYSLDHAREHEHAHVPRDHGRDRVRGRTKSTLAPACHPLSYTSHNDTRTHTPPSNGVVSLILGVDDRRRE